VASAAWPGRKYDESLFYDPHRLVANEEDLLNSKLDKNEEIP